ncbi:MAG: hypothetical protein J5I93_28650 [Pirellulaceae bacterium]|nr:hypothetical protein [Pirellulaceae bacterium]
MQKLLDRKLERILSDPDCKEFILADAKDADMGLGIAAPGPAGRDAEGRERFRSLEQYRQFMRDLVRAEAVDIMLMSASTSQRLTIEERLFDNSPVTPAVRANDTTDIWCGMSGRYSSQPSLPFRTSTIDDIQCGHQHGTPEERARGANLGLYSITFNNDAQRDREALEAYRGFRLEAELRGFRHFLEVFAPNACGPHPPADVGRYVNDCIVRCLAGIPRRGRPLFLKIPYFGPAAMEALVQYDRTIVVGILGGSAGTTHDAFHLLWEAKRYGARVALFGRKINHAEDQLAFVRLLRRVADDELSPFEAVRAYHGALQTAGIAPHRSLEDDLRLT